MKKSNNIKTLLLSVLLITTFSVNANFFSDLYEKAASKIVGLDPSIVNVQNLKYIDEHPDFIWNGRNSTSVKGSVFNSSDTKTIKTIVFKYDVLECATGYQNCTIIYEDEERWHTNIPPKQVRHFDHAVSYKKGDSDNIRFRQIVKYVHPF
jgi:hypothetical protein